MIIYSNIRQSWIQNKTAGFLQNCMKYEPDAAVVSNLSSPVEDSGSDDRSGVENFSV